MGKELAQIGNLEKWTVVTALDKVLEGVASMKGISPGL